MKKLYNIVTLVCAATVMAAFFFSCATIGPVPAGCENSLIYKLVPNPQQTGVFLRMGNLVMIDKGYYSAQQAIDTIEKIRKELDRPSITYMLLANFVDEQISPYFVLIGELVPQFATYDIPISECDIQLLKKHLVEQEAIARLRM